jgi:hypothetical protein
MGCDLGEVAGGVGGTTIDVGDSESRNESE